MVKVPEGLLYTREHEWARVEADGTVVVGITLHAVDALGDVAFVDLPDGGTEVRAGIDFGAVESVKAVSELYSPVSGEVVEANAGLEERPELVNDDPYGEGWLVRIAPSDPAELEELMGPAEYEAYLAES